MEAITRYFVQKGSSQDLHVSDNDAWYVIRQTWPNMTSALSQCEIEIKCCSRAEAAELCEIYNAPPEPLSTLAARNSIGYDTLVKAAQEGRLAASKNGKVWVSTRRDVREYLARMTPKPRK